MMKLEEKPDCGRAWLIAMAACVINMILSGISRMIGMLFVAVIDVYGVSRQEATMPFSVRNSVRCLAGPLVGLVGLHLEIRTVTFCGGVVAALGACLCSIAPSVMWLTIFWGVIHGFGFAFANTLFQVVVNQYFEKYRATASGIALSGACVGSLVFPFMFEAILNKYDLDGAFLILGGLVMNVLPPALLLVPPPWLKNKQQMPARNDADNTPITATEKAELNDMDLIDDYKSCRILHSQSFSNCPTEDAQLVNVRKSATFNRPRRKPPTTLCIPAQQNSGVHPCPPAGCKDITICGLISTPEEESTDDSGIFTVENAYSKNEAFGNNSVNASDNNVVNIPDNNTVNGNENNVVPDENNGKPDKQADGFLLSIMSIFRLYKNPAFVLISLCMVAYIIIFIPMLAVIVDYSKDKGFPEASGKYLISAMAFGDLIGRLCFGWVTDRQLMTISNFMMTSLLLQGVVVIMIPLAQSLYTMIGLLALYGMTAGSVLVLFPILVFKHVSLDDQPIAMGCVGFLSGMVTFGLPPFIGYFRDGIGSYDGMFYIAASVSIVSGILWLLEPVASRHRKKCTQAVLQKR